MFYLYFGVTYLAFYTFIWKTFAAFDAIFDRLCGIGCFGCMISFVFTGCLIFVCLALFESALVSYFSKSLDQNHHQVAELIEQLLKKHNKVSAGTSSHGNDEISKRNKIFFKLNKTARLLLPAGFLMFNLVYWIYYL